MKNFVIIIDKRQGADVEIGHFIAKMRVHKEAIDGDLVQETESTYAGYNFILNNSTWSAEKVKRKLENFLERVR